MILIVDDYPDAAEALCRLLRHEGYPATTLSDGRSALAYIRSHPPEMPLLVVLDQMMPGFDGTAVLREIRSDPKIAHTAVLFHTAGFDVEKREEAMTLGAVAWLYKGGAASLSIPETIKSIGHWYEKVGGVKGKAPSAAPAISPPQPRQP
jgi:CheY-like chemotaxis protein